MPACSMFCSIWRNWGSLEFEVGLLISPFLLACRQLRWPSQSLQVWANLCSACLTCGLSHMWTCIHDVAPAKAATGSNGTHVEFSISPGDKSKCRECCKSCSYLWHMSCCQRTACSDLVPSRLRPVIPQDMSLHTLIPQFFAGVPAIV